MNVVNVLGWIAMGGTLLSFVPKSMYKLRLINGIASIVWIVYGIMKLDYPIITINSSVIVMHGYWFWMNRNK
jgi:hypothetical protein